jgi:hypothetical protein
LADSGNCECHASALLVSAELVDRLSEMAAQDHQNQQLPFLAVWFARRVVAFRRRIS